MSASPADRGPPIFLLPQDLGNGSGQDPGTPACRAYLSTLFEHIPLAVVVLDLADRVTAANPAFQRLLGCSATELMGRALADLALPAHLTERRVAIRVEDEPVAHYVFYQEAADPPRIAAEPLEPPTREPSGPAVELADERQRQLLAGALALLDSGESVAARLRRLTRFLVPVVADSCILYLRDAHDRVQRAEIALADPAQEQLLREHLRNYPLVSSRLIPPVERALETGEPQLLPEVRIRALKAIPGDEEHVSIAFLLGITSLLVVPLLRDGRVLGALSLATLDSGRAYQTADLPLVEEIARGAAALLACQA